MSATYVDTRSREPETRERARLRLARALVLVFAALLVLTLGIALGRRSIHVPQQGTDPPNRTAQQFNTANSVGPAVVIDGVGTGWQRSKAGAVAAATSYLVGFNSRAYATGTKQRRRILTAILTRQQRADIPKLVGTSETPPPGSPLAAAYADARTSAYRYVPIGYRLESYTDNGALVRVWGFSLYAGTGSANVAASSAWATARVPVVWEANDWKLDAAGVFSAGRANACD